MIKYHFLNVGWTNFKKKRKKWHLKISDGNIVAIRLMMNTINQFVFRVMAMWHRRRQFLTIPRNLLGFSVTLATTPLVACRHYPLTTPQHQQVRRQRQLQRRRNVSMFCRLQQLNYLFRFEFFVFFFFPRSHIDSTLSYPSKNIAWSCPSVKATKRIRLIPYFLWLCLLWSHFFSTEKKM